MDTGTVEAILGDIGKAFRLCRFYPPSHPSVQQALASLSTSLPALARTGPIELRLQPAGMIFGAAPLAPRNTQIQELARLLYSQGHRLLVLSPGLTSDEVATLIRSAASGTERVMQAVGGQAAYESLPHIRLERSFRKSASPDAGSRSGPHAAEMQAMNRRSTTAFRPDALPPEIEASRLAAQLERGEGNDVAAAADRLGVLLGELLNLREFRHLASAARALAQCHGDSAREALDKHLTGAILAGLLSLLSDASARAEDRDLAVQALGALGERAIPAVFDACLVAHGTDTRDILLAVVRRAGAAAAAPILARMDPDARGEIARTNALLLGATRSPEAALMLGALAMHAEPPVRRAAVEALVHIDDPEAQRHLLGALRDSDAAVRAAAARGIGWSGDPSQAPLLVARLETEADEDAAVAMIEALADLRDPRSIPLLEKLTHAVSGVFQRRPTEVRAAAVKAIEAMRGGLS